MRSLTTILLVLSLCPPGGAVTLREDAESFALSQPVLREAWGKREEARVVRSISLNDESSLADDPAHLVAQYARNRTGNEKRVGPVVLIETERNQRAYSPDSGSYSFAMGPMPALRPLTDTVSDVPEDARSPEEALIGTELVQTRLVQVFPEIGPSRVQTLPLAAHKDGAIEYLAVLVLQSHERWRVSFDERVSAKVLMRDGRAVRIQFVSL